MRGPAPADASLPALGYLHLEGRAFTSGGSRANPVEARTIAAWLEESRALLEDRYGRPLEQVVGVITPFGQQVRSLRMLRLQPALRSFAAEARSTHSCSPGRRPLAARQSQQLFARKAGFIFVSRTDKPHFHLERYAAVSARTSVDRRGFT